MAVTSDGLFSSVIQTAPGLVWINLELVLSDLTGQSTSVANTQTIEFDAPLAGAEIPVDSVITDIQITVLWFHEVGETINGELTIAGGDTQTFVIPESGTTGEVYPGDLAYWGITAEQAADFANGIGGQTLDLRMIENSGSVQVACGFAKALFTYEPAPPTGGVIPNPVIF